MRARKFTTKPPPPPLFTYMRVACVWLTPPPPLQREVKLRMDRDKQQKNAVKKKETTSVLGKMLGPITQMFSPGGSKKKTNGWAERDSGDTSSGGSSGADKIAAALPPPAAAAIAIVANPAMKKKMDLQVRKRARRARRERADPPFVHTAPPLFVH